MGNPYPAEFTDDSGIERLGGAITFTDPANQPGGGSSAGSFEIVEVAVAFDTPNILTGIELYVPTADEVARIFGYYTSETGWDGNSPTFHLYSQGDTPGAQDIYAFSLPSSADLPSGTHTRAPKVDGVPNATVIYDDATPVMGIVDDGSGGDPGSMQGAGTLVICLQRIR